MIEQIKRIIDNVDLVCFDIFDTIVSRSCFPDYTKSLFCKYLKDIFDLKISSEDLIDIRKTIERAFYDKSRVKYNDEEFKYEDFAKALYSYLKENEKINIDSEKFVELCIDIEISIEKKVQYVQPDILEILKFCKENKKRTVCVSDMYLSKTMLENIFKYHGILEYIDYIYVSSEFYKTKRSGLLYDEVLKQEKIEPNKVLMIGDNLYVDYKMPSRYGIRAYQVKHKGLKEYYEDSIKNHSLNSFQKNNSYIINKDDYNSEYEKYNQVYKLVLNLYKKNYKEIYIEDSDEIFINYFKEIVREISMYLGISLVDEKKSIIQIYSNSKTLLIKNNKKILEKKDIEFANSNFSLFRKIVKNRISEIYDDKNLINIQKNNIKNYNVSSKEINILINQGREYSYLFYRFIKWILDDCKNKNINKIYFFTREGEFFKEIADKLTREEKMELEILEVSRISTFCPSICDVTQQEMKRIWNLYTKQSILSFCKSVDIKVDDIIPIIEKYGLSINEEINMPAKDIRLKNLFADKYFIKYMNKQISNKREAILKYFETKNLYNKKQNIAIVDIGWRGTIQDNISYMLDKVTIYGYYFGLNKFFNVQPENVYKYGFLNQYNGAEKYLDNVTPFEMICNSPNGSTIGYDNNKAIRKIDEIENSSYDNCIKYLQKGILENINNNDFKSYSDQKIFEILSNIIFKPNKLVAKAYFNLKHNEEFGLGGYIDKSRKFKYRLLLMAPFSKKNRTLFRQDLIDSTWPQGYLKISNLGFLNNHFKTKNLREDDSKMVTKRIAWFIPKPIKGSGGHRTIIQNANMLVKKGYICDLYLEEDFISTSDGMKKIIIDYFGECLCEVYIGAKLRKEYDLVFATHAIATPEFVKYCDCKNKGYFIQDFEPWFMPMGETYIDMENSYKYNFKGVSIGKWLSYKLKKEYSMNMRYFNFCADLNIYKPLKDVEKENAICFIYQPEKPRRCSNLGIAALKIVKEIRPDIKIYLYGSNDDNNAIECENLHIIKLDECNKLYNKCSVGLCISASNPSRIPFEMMAAGLPVVDLYKENNLYDMPDSGILLADSTPEAIATALIKIIDDKNLAKKMSKNGIEFMKDYPLEKGYEQFLDSVDKMFNSNYKLEEDIEKIYNKEPIMPSLEIMDVANKMIPVPFVQNSSPFVRKLVRIKKGILRRIRRIIGK